MYGRGSQQSSSSFGPPITPPVIKNLMIANLVFFMIQQASREFTVYGSVTPMAVWQGGYLWQPFTYMWLHGSLGHIGMNMFSLWMFGSPLAMAWGPQRFLRFYLICGVGAGVIIATYPYFVETFIPGGLMVRTLGASGAVYGVILAYSMAWPDRTIALIFPPIAFKAIWLIPGLFLMTVMMGGGGISHTGHLGGVIVAWIYLRRTGRTGAMFSFAQLKLRWKRHRMRQKLRAVRYEDHEEQRKKNDRNKFH